MKKALCIILALIMMVFVPISVAASGDDCDCGEYPTIHVPGIGAALYLNPGTADAVKVFPPSADGILEPLKVLPGAIAGSLVGFSWDSFSAGLVTAASEMFKYLACDENGKSVYNVDVKPNTVSAEEHSDGNRYTFDYDWRLDPIETAEKLDKYIDKVRAVTGHSKIKLEAHSEGAIIISAYLEEFGTAKLDKMVYIDGAFQGLTLMGKLYCKDVGIDADSVARYADVMLPKNLGGVKLLIKAIDMFGSLDKLVEALTLVIDNCFDDLYDGFVRPTFGHMPALWGFVNHDYYETAIATMFGGDPKYDNLEFILDYYHYNVQTNMRSKLNEACDNGVGVAIISNYGFSPMPFTKNDLYVTDALIDSKNSSGGATFAPYGTSFADDYKQAIDCGHNHISPDRDIDASTAMLPERTWFVKGYNHWALPDELSEFILSSDNDVNVFTSEEYPQFLIGTEDGAVTPNVKVEKEASFLDILRDIFKFIFNLIKSMF